MNYVSIAAIVGAFALIVLVHEAGHFLAARLSGMAVHEFSIGFGRPLLLWFRRGNTQYSLRLWPFISYVRVAGMEPGDDHPQGFNTKSRLAQAFVLVTGCLMNFLLAVCIYIAIGALIGLPVADNRVKTVLPGMPAAAAKLLPGDRIVGLHGRTGMPVEDIRRAIQASPGKALQLTVERDGRLRAVAITPARDTTYRLKGLRLVEAPIGLIGVHFAFSRQRAGMAESVALGFEETYRMIQFQAAALIATAARRVPADFMGPVGVVHTMYAEARSGWADFLTIFAAIAVTVGFINLLPIPPLDGSRLLIVVLEAVRRKPFDKRKESLVHLVGLAVILALFVLLTYRDIVRIATAAGE
ncbi:MAG: RIP metalloprotease [Armatimonadota bacterium]